MNAISNALGLPRVIVAAPAARPLSAAERSVAAHVDHAVGWLDEFLSQNAADLKKTKTSSEFKTDALRLRQDLLAPAPRALSGEATEKLASSVQSIEQLNQNLSDRAAALPRQATSDTPTAGYHHAAEAVRKLAALSFKPAKAAKE